MNALVESLKRLYHSKKLTYEQVEDLMNRGKIDFDSMNYIIAED